MARGFLEPNVLATRYYRNLEQTEKGGYSFLFGEEFTHWYAQKYMNLPVLVHVQGLRSCTWAQTKMPHGVKPGASIPSAASRPDFIGMDGSDYHVFESKGRSRNPDAQSICAALGQVSAIAKVNGTPPVTRCATFFMLKAKTTEGWVIDPPARGVEWGISFDKFDALRKVYQVFIDIEPSVDMFFGAGRRFLGIPVDDQCEIGIDVEIYKALKVRSMKPQDRSRIAEEVLQMLGERRHEYSAIDHRFISAGIDGIFLKDRGEFEAAIE
ncbi:hypothetical protein QCN27_20505 [Cereibacter sp. SYSU M97828]|nr:hypothetical protein [Cereibacter flavus]